MKTLAQKHARIAAAMAMSNMGQAVPDNVADERYGWHSTAEEAVMDLAGHLMESYDHETIFAEEAEGWYKSIVEWGIPKFTAMYPHHKVWLDAIAAIEEK